jgi:hypothetical protein
MVNGRLTGLVNILCRNCFLQQVIEGKIKRKDKSDRKMREKT